MYVYKITVGKLIWILKKLPFAMLYFLLSLSNILAEKEIKLL
tara:strand:+ start:5082 stop:5207 length:126 start_codon:yes stop_codon:yes gene_type:complete